MSVQFRVERDVEDLARIINNRLASLELLPVGAPPQDVGAESLAAQMRTIVSGLQRTEDKLTETYRSSSQRAYFVLGGVFLTVSTIFIVFVYWTYGHLSREFARVQGMAEDQKMLVRELNHRVKNSLQNVASVLRLQISRLPRGSAEVRAALTTAMDRVAAVANVHQSLYELQKSDIPARGFIEELFDKMREAYGVRIDASIKEVTLDLDYAVPLALLLNELLTNSAKYGHAVGDKPIVSVKFGPAPGAEETHWELRFRDYGPGFPDGFVPGSKGSLGHMLIESLSRQLGAEEITYRNSGEGGVLFHITAPNTQKGVDVAGTTIASRREAA